MRRTAAVLIATVLAASAAFVAGWVARERVAGSAPPEREVLYWVDPMNPGFRSPEPGVAPCGMPLEPVYADGTGTSSTGPAAIHVPGDRRQLVGIVVEPVAVAPVEGTLRLRGTVIADERRAHVVSTRTVGTVQTLGDAGVGSIVRRGELLLSLSSSATLNAQSTLFQALDDLERGRASGADAALVEQYERRVQSSRRTLLNYGVTEDQVESIERSRRPTATIDIRSPVSGFVLARQAALGREFHADAPLFVIAPLDRVDLLAELTAEEVVWLDAAVEATVLAPELPEPLAASRRRGGRRFDRRSGVHLVRYRVDNVGRRLLPGMTVELRLSLRSEPALSVPIEAVIDTGERRSVFVDLGEGRFDSREIETGWRLAGRTRVVEGLSEGDRVVVSGTFLLDSESRMRSSAARPSP